VVVVVGFSFSFSSPACWSGLAGYFVFARGGNRWLGKVLGTFDPLFFSFFFHYTTTTPTTGCFLCLFAAGWLYGYGSRWAWLGATNMIMTG
jgi:hypothetical protein